MRDKIITILAILPIGAVIGWFANRLLAPTFDELGVRLKSWAMPWFCRDEYSIYVAYSKLHKMISALHKQGHKYFNAQKPYLHSHEINLEVKGKTDGHLRNVATMWVRQTHINSYADSDIFFAGLELLLLHLTRSNIADIFSKYKNNSQAGLWPFLEIIENKRPDLLTDEISSYLHGEQRKWRTFLAEQREKEN